MFRGHETPSFQLTSLWGYGRLSSDSQWDSGTLTYAGREGFPELLGNDYSESRIPRGEGAAYATDTPIPPNLADLVRLHRLARERKASTILEFGVGYSTLVLADALSRNQEEHGPDLKVRNIRRANPYELHSVDSGAYWIELTAGRLPKRLRRYVRFHQSPVFVTEFNGRICHKYESLPNICPDFVYVDGPSPFSVKGEMSGIDFRHSDRTVLSCDLLKIEWLLLPGTLIIIDGRTNNARFLRANFQRAFAYRHLREEDVHTFELIEPSLGPHNSRQIEFFLGAERLRSDFLGTVP